jgi:1-acyl-sn-glycerol-3-phosphate acyltransferase
MFVYWFFGHLVHFLLLFVGTLRVFGKENIPSSGPYIVIVNHMSKADPPLVMISMPNVQMRFFAGEYWERHLIFGPMLRWTGGIFIKRGTVDRKALAEASDSLEEGCIFGLAPEGTRSRVGELIRARNGAAYIATRVNVPILPIGVVDTDLIARNLPKLRPTEMEVRIGQPFHLPDLDEEPRSSELAAYTHYLMIHIARLLPERHWGYYAESPALMALINDEDPWPACLEIARSSPARTTSSGRESDSNIN